MGDGVPVPLALQEWIEEPKASVRRLLQVWGTEYRRWQDEDYWVKALRAWLACREPGENVVVDDVRFRNEAELIHERGGLLVRLEPWDGWEPGPHSDHPSETQLDEYQKFHMVLRPRRGELDSAVRRVYEVAKIKTACDRWNSSR